jgi:Fic family protein
MDPARFVAPRWGRVVSTGGRSGYQAFVPAPLPRSLDLDMPTVRILSEADAALGRLAGAGRVLPNPHLLITPYRLQEALASSRIEGTQATLSEVFDAEASGETRNADVREVQNYVAALEHGLRRLPDFPLSTRLIREMHDILLDGVRGQEKTPGQFRTSQNWIGSPDNRPATAVFVPPTVENMRPALDDWERFVHDPAPELPLLIRIALLHYQFETIHPFLDGNGRIGRLLVILYLVERDALPAPLLPVSTYLESRRSEYYERLQAVRERGEVGPWLRFFLGAVATVARDAVTRTERLVDLRERYRDRLRGIRSRAYEVVDLMFTNPVLTVPLVAGRLGMTQQGAVNPVRQLVALGILRERSGGRGVLARYYADDVLAALEP